MSRKSENSKRQWLFSGFFQWFPRKLLGKSRSENDKRAGNQGFEKSAEIGHGLLLIRPSLIAPQHSKTCVLGAFVPQKSGVTELWLLLEPLTSGSFVVSWQGEDSGKFSRITKCLKSKDLGHWERQTCLEPCAHHLSRFFCQRHSYNLLEFFWEK